MDVMVEAFAILRLIFGGVLALFDRVFVFFNMDDIIISALFMSCTFGFFLVPIMKRGNYGSSDSVKDSKKNKGDV